MGCPLPDHVHFSNSIGLRIEFGTRALRISENVGREISQLTYAAEKGIRRLQARRTEGTEITAFGDALVEPLSIVQI